MLHTTSTTPFATGTISFNFKIVKNEDGPSTLQITSNLDATIAPNNTTSILRGDSAQNNNILRAEPYQSDDIDDFMLSSKELEEIKHMTDSEFNDLFNDTDVDDDILKLDDEQHRHTKVSTEAAAAASEVSRVKRGRGRPRKNPLKVVPSGKKRDVRGRPKGSLGIKNKKELAAAAAAAAAAAGANSGSDNKSSDDDDDSSDHSIHSSDDDDSDDDEATAHPPSPREQPAQTPSRKRARKCQAPSRSTIMAPRHLNPRAQVAPTRAGCSKCRYNKRGCNAQRCIRIGPKVNLKKEKNLRFEKKFEMKHTYQKW